MKIFPILVLLFLGSCGYKTAPKPYPSISKGLTKVEQEKIYFEGNQLVLEWKAPKRKRLKEKQKSTAEHEDQAKSDKEEEDSSEPMTKQEDQSGSEPGKENISNIYLYRLKVMTPGSCPACEDQLIEKMQILNRPPFLQSNPEGIQVYQNGNRGFRILMPNNYLSKFDKYSLLYFSIDYYTTNGALSPSSGNLYPKKPVLIPVPDIKWKVMTSKALQPKSTIESETPQELKESKYLLINWKPVLEKEVHVIQSNSKLKIVKQYYGLILFMINTDNKEEWISPTPLYEGQYLISDTTHQVWAKYLDRFGNYSQKTLLYPP